MRTRWFIGLASGSSADSVDAALVETVGVGLEMRARLLAGEHHPYPEDLRQVLRQAASGEPIEARQISLLHRLLGETFAAAARSVADRARFSLQRIQCIGCPGHTIWHDTDGRFAHTLSLGMPAVIAERLGVTTVGDFRARDVAAGGQGVPLAALTDYLLFRDPGESRLLIHLGGLARLVFLPAGCSLSQVTGFEAAPCNILLDGLMRRITSGRESYDPGGRHAVQGRCMEPLLASWLRHPYLQRRPPKSLPRQLFADAFTAEAITQAREMQGSLHDLLCTATHFVARSITDAIRRYLPPVPTMDRILVSGGGARNGLLWGLLEQQLGGSFLARTEDVGISSQLRKPMSFALLAALTVDGVNGNVPAATGAAGARLLGSLTPGSPTSWARCLAWMAEQVGSQHPHEELESYDGRDAPHL